MAKVPFTKLKCKINTDEVPVQIGEETIAIKQYLPIQEKQIINSKQLQIISDKNTLKKITLFVNKNNLNK